MKHIKLLTLFFLITGCTIQSKLPKRDKVDIYLSSSEFLNKKTNKFPWETEIKKIGDDYVKISTIYREGTSKYLQSKNRPWAINIKGEDYINMYYSQEYKNANVYAKYNITGKICALFISRNTSDIIRDGNYSLGIVNGVINDFRKVGKEWIDADGNNIFILTINMTRVQPNSKKLWKKHTSRLLSKHNFNVQLNTNYNEEEIKNFTFENVVEIIKKQNLE